MFRVENPFRFTVRRKIEILYDGPSTLERIAHDFLRGAVVNEISTGLLKAGVDDRALFIPMIHAESHGRV